MSFYEERILPYLLNVAMNTRATRQERVRVLEEVKGDVLEVGFGTGLNLPHYRPGVTKVVGIDPSQVSARLARKRISAAAFPVELIGLSAEKIPIPDASFESVVSTFTLCSIPDVSGALTEIRRTLKPGGRFYFVEHGLSDDPHVVRWQERLDPIEQKVFGGCHFTRRISTLITQAGFEMEHLENDYLKGAPKFAGYLYRGVARRPES